MSVDFDLLTTVEYGGCSPKIPASVLESILLNLPKASNPNVLVDIDTHDDAGVYRVNDDLALIFTTDFFTPVCSDPYEFGQIAATNSLSDVYAMGGEPFFALNIAMFPSGKIPLNAYKQILEGGASVAQMANTIVIGGHTIDDYPQKYGLAVVGRVHPGKVITNAILQPGDALILSKPLGIGMVIAAKRLGIVSKTAYSEALFWMKQLNNTPAHVIQAMGVEGATDITGFGLIGHVYKMAKVSNVAIKLYSSKIPLLPEAFKLVEEGCIPGAAFRNLEYVGNFLQVESGVDYNAKMLMCDAQTSGGILMGVRPERVDETLKLLHCHGLRYSMVIGEVIKGNNILIAR